MTDIVPALVLVGSLLALALAGALMLRQAAAAACCLALLRRRTSRWSVMAVALAAGLLLADFTAGPARAALTTTGTVLSFVLLVMMFGRAARGPSLGTWQAAAAAAAWLLLGGPRWGAAAATLLVALALRAVLLRDRGEARDDGSFNGFLGGMLAVLASAGAINGGGSVVLWLMPLAPLALDMVAGLGRGMRVTVLEHVARAGGTWQTAGRVAFALGFGWYGMAAWWAKETQASVPWTAFLASLPVLFAMVVVTLSMRPLGVVAAAPAPDRGGAGHSHIRGLDGLRAVAVALVVLSHAGLMETDFWQRTGAGTLLNAHVGVQIFFVLSGLLITQLLLSEHARTGRIDLPRFYLRRLLRIFPVYYSALAVSFALAAAGVYLIKLASFQAAIAYVMNFAHWDNMEATFSHFWSLAVEEHFYFFWPLGVVLARGRVHAAAAIAATAILLMVWWQAAPPEFMQALGKSHAVNRWTIPAALPILVGCLAAIALWWRRPARAGAGAAGVLGLAGFLLPMVPSLNARVPEAMHALVSSAAIAGMMVFIVCAQGSWVVRLLETRALVYLGTISYGIYVWQGILTGNGSYRQVPHWPPSPVAGAVAACLVAAASYHFFEKPILAYKEKLKRPHDGGGQAPGGGVRQGLQEHVRS